MLDKLHFRTHSEISKNIIDELIISDHFSRHGILDKNYKSCLIIRKDGKHFITIKRTPTLSNNWPTYLELNPSKFTSLREMLNFLKRLKVDPYEAEISRIDHCSDMDISLEEVRSSLIVKGKRRRSDYEDKDKLTGLYFGKNLEVISIYDKKVESQFRKEKSNNSCEDLTRFEVRQKGKAILYNKVIDLPKYLEYDPYSKLQFYNVLTEKFKQENLHPRDLFFHQVRDDRGLHAAYRALNAHSNFKRNFEKKIVDSSFSADITAKYHQGLNSFLKG